MATTVQIVIACRDPNRLAAFWRTALGYAEEPPPDGYASWDERKELVGAAVARLEAAGATRLQEVVRRDTYWAEMADPEGGWFCVQ